MKYFNLHTHQSSKNPDVLELVNQYPQEFDVTIPFFSVGIHPWHIVTERIAEDLDIIESKLEGNNCGAIGECGLDKRIDAPLDLQVEVFEKQLILAEKYNKPVVIHCVAAFQEVIEIKKRLKISVPLIIHGFSKSREAAKQLLDNEFYLSFGKYLLRNPELESVFKWVPNERFFLETDTIEEGIEDVYKVAAKYRKQTIEELQHLLNDNFNLVFANQARN